MGSRFCRNPRSSNLIKKLLIPLSAVLVLWAGASCTQPLEPPVETGGVELSFTIGEPLTRAVTPGNGTVADGGGIYLDNGVPDLKIFILGGGSVVARYPGSSATLTSVSDTRATVKFTGLENNATYKVYAFANTGSSLTVNGSPDWNSIGTATALDALVYTALADYTPPSVGDRMPLSAKGTLSVNSYGSGSVDLELLRSLAKVQVTFKNLTASVLTLTNCAVSITSINPTQGYVFQHSGDDVTGTNRMLTFPTQTLSDIPIQEGVNEASLNPLLVFPSIAEMQGGYRRYLCSISFKVGDNNHDFTNLPVHNSLSQDITSLGRNQFLKIEVRISRGEEISFNFEVANWVEKTESVEFD